MASRWQASPGPLFPSRAVGTGLPGSWIARRFGKGLFQPLHFLIGHFFHEEGGANALPSAAAGANQLTRPDRVPVITARPALKPRHVQPLPLYCSGAGTVIVQD